MAELRTSILLRHSAAEVFDYFIDDHQLSRWLASTAQVNAVTGGWVEIEADGRHIDARILELVPPHRILMDWRICWPDPVGSIRSRLELAIRPDPVGVRVEVIHWHLPEEVLPQLGTAWTARLARLENSLGSPTNTHP